MRLRFNKTLVRLLVAAGLAAALAPIISAFSIVIVPVGTNPSGMAIIPQTDEVAVANSGSDDVSIVDPVTNHVSTVPAGTLPTAIAVNAVTGYAYVVNTRSNSVTAIYGYGEGKKRKIYATGGGGWGIAVNSATNRVYVVNNEDGTVSAIDENTGTTTTIAVGQRARGIAINEVTNRIYVTNIWDNTVTVIDGSTNSPIATVPVVMYPYDVVVNPVTNQIYVGSGEVSAITVIDGATYNTFDIPGIWEPAYLAINTRTNKIYAAGAQSNGGIMVIDGATGTSTQLSTPVGPFGFNSLIQVVVNEATNKVYVVDSMSKNLLVVDGATNEITFRTLEFNPNLVAVNPTNNRVYVSHLGEGLISIISE